MLQLAIQAQLPIVAASTRDTLNLIEVLTELTGKTPHVFEPNTIKAQDSEGQLFVYGHMDQHVDSDKLPLHALYQNMVQRGSTLLLINPKRITDLMFDAGEIPTPKPLLERLLTEVVSSKAKATELMRGLGGCTIKEAAELARLTMARDKSLTADGIMVTRKSSFQASKGLTQVDTTQEFYEPNPGLKAWVAAEKAFFLTGKDPRLIPRGLLFDGPPGVGKTAGAKWLSNQLGVPLYRVDIGGTKNKYVGESESNMLTNLARLDNEEPCVALLDEVEKVFATSNNDSSGTTSTMLSQLLWWLSERRSRVLVIMTTNNAQALPKELYREGRVDRVMWFGGLEEGAAEKFVDAILATFKKPFEKGTRHEIVKAAMVKNAIPTDPPTVSQAALTTAVYDWIKSQK